MSPSALPELVAFAAVAVFVIYRQLAPRRVRGAGQMFILPLILTGYGAYSLLQSPPTAVSADLLLAGELVIAAGAGILRALTVRFWVAADGALMQRGTWLTLVVWFAFIGVRVGADFLLHGALSTGALMISVGASLLVQSAITSLRSQALLQRASQPQGLYR